MRGGTDKCSVARSWLDEWVSHRTITRDTGIESCVNPVVTGNCIDESVFENGIYKCSAKTTVFS